MTNTMLVSEGMDVLIKNLGNVDAERFISLIIKEPFDYTKWQRGLFPNTSVEDIFAVAKKDFEKNAN